MKTMKGKRKSIASEKVDRISRLPDELIHEILSSIDAKHAIQTSVLSKRWENVWRSLPCIRVDWNPFLSEIYRSCRSPELTFIGYVDNIFNLRDDSDMKMFDLGFVVLSHTAVDALNRWILAAVDSNVEVIVLHLFYIMSSPYELPRELLNCESLKTLDIEFFGVPPGLILPESMSLPQLKNLSLEGFSISNSELHRLFSSCPLIETLSIKGCDILMNNSILVDSQSLQTLRLIDNRHRHVGSVDNILAGTSTTKISAPNVKDFKCTSVMTEIFSAINLSSVGSAHLRMRSTEKEEDETADTYSELPAEEKVVFAIRMMKFLGDVQKVHHLTLSSGFLEVLLQAPGTLYRQPPQLSNLETMKLEMRFTRDCLLSVAYLLKISPVITTLILISKESNLADDGDDWEAEFSLMCMSSHLKSVEIREMEGCDIELKFLGCLLKNSSVLQKLTLFFKSASDTLDNRRQIRLFKRNLKVLPAASSNIQLKF